MTLRPTSPLRALCAMMCVIAAFVLAPTGAWAHATHHHHGPTLAVTGTHQHHQGAVSAKKTVAVDAAGKVVRAKAELSSVMVKPESQREATDSCPDCCCHSGGTGCCAAWVAASATFSPPSAGRQIFELTAEGGAGTTPGTLPKPPKLLV